MPTVALTKCNYDPCPNMTENTFCSRECNRLAHLGPGTRTTPRADTSGTAKMHHDYRFDDYLTVGRYLRERNGEQDTSMARRRLNERKRREARDAAMKVRREKRRRRANA